MQLLRCKKNNIYIIIKFRIDFRERDFFAYNSDSVAKYCKQNVRRFYFSPKNSCRECLPYFFGYKTEFSFQYNTKNLDPSY